MLPKAHSALAFRKRLLAWYDANRRPLPWRKTRDPYRIWVSEVMLQQTRVAAVLEYYKRFLAMFPSVKALARAGEQEVLAQWSGLGYYRRARMMHAAARQLMAERRRFPRTAEQLRKLPGIGRYTAAAIASIAFNEPVAVVDGNVERVLNRLAGGDIPRFDHWSAAQTLLDHTRPGDFNQAMMELGATICVPKDPGCGACPVKRWCGTRGAHNTAKSPARKRVTIGYLWARVSGKIALVQRHADTRLMPGMWELPQLRRPLPRTQPSLTVRHSITVTDFVAKVWTATPPADSKLVTPARAARLPLTGLTRKILKRMQLLHHP